MAWLLKFHLLVAVRVSLRSRGSSGLNGLLDWRRGCPEVLGSRLSGSIIGGHIVGHPGRRLGMWRRSDSGAQYLASVAHGALVNLLVIIADFLAEVERGLEGITVLVLASAGFVGFHRFFLQPRLLSLLLSLLLLGLLHALLLKLLGGDLLLNIGVLVAWALFALGQKRSRDPLLLDFFGVRGLSLIVDAIV